MCAIDDKIAHTVPEFKPEVLRTRNGTVTHHKKVLVLFEFLLLTKLPN